MAFLITAQPRPVQTIVPECCEFPQWSCSAENNELNSLLVPAGSEAGLINKDSTVTEVCYSTPSSFPTAQPSGDIGLCLCLYVAEWLEPPLGTPGGAERCGRPIKGCLFHCFSRL